MPFICPSDKRWSELLEISTPDFYHLPGFAEIEAELLGGEATAWYFENGDQHCLIPLIKRPISKHGIYDLVSPYGYPGMLSNGKLSAEKALHLFECFNHEAAKEAFVSSFIRMNPFINQWMFDGLMNGNEKPFEQLTHGETVSIDMKSGISTIRRQFSENHKRHLKKLKNLGCQIAINNWTYRKDFISAYRQTMKRKSAQTYYFFPSSYFGKLKKLLGNRLALITISDKEGKMLSGGLFTQFDKVMQFHLGGTIDEAVNLSPSKMMMDAAVIFGKLNDAEILHLGGGVSANTSDGLFRYKKGFGGRFFSFSTLRFIHQPEVYQKLCKSLKANKQDKNYFPAYRS